MKLKFVPGLVLCLLAGAANATSITTTGAGKPAGGAPPAYTGPLDVSGFSTNVIACYSLQACASALRGLAALNACDSTGGTDVACADLLTDATTGLLVPATIGGGTCPGTLGTNCTVKTWYGYTASGLATTQCGGSDCHLKTNGTGISARPLLIASGYGSGPAVTFTQTQGLDTFTTSLTLAQPYTQVAVACQIADRGGLDLFFGNNSANGAMYWSSTPQLSAYAGSAYNFVNSTRNTWQQYAVAFDDAGTNNSQAMVSSGSVVNGGNTGGSGFSSTAIAANVLGFPAIFRAAEFILFSGNKSGGVTGSSFTAIQGNEATRFGSGSC